MILMGRFKKATKVKKIRIGNLLSVGTISIVLIACFGLLGASYASWSQNFSIFGTITTGEVNVIVRDVALDSSDEHDYMSFNAIKSENVIDEVVIDVTTDTSPFGMVLNVTLENVGTLPVKCTGIDRSDEEIDITILGDLPIIAPGQTAIMKIRVDKGYCEGFVFSTFLKFEQAL